MLGGDQGGQPRLDTGLLLEQLANGQVKVVIRPSLETRRHGSAQSAAGVAGHGETGENGSKKAGGRTPADLVHGVESADVKRRRRVRFCDGRAQSCSCSCSDSWVYQFVASCTELLGRTFL
jgi:hypothetical protein